MNEAIKDIQLSLDEIKKLLLMMTKSTYNVKEAAIFTGLSVQRLNDLRSRRQIPYYKRYNSNLCYFDKEELEKWMKSVKIPTEDSIVSNFADKEINLD